VEIESGVVEGRFPRMALNAAMERFELHRDEPLLTWVLAEQRRRLIGRPLARRQSRQSLL